MGTNLMPTQGHRHSCSCSVKTSTKYYVSQLGLGTGSVQALHESVFKAHSHWAKAGAKVNFFFGLFFSLIRFRLVWMGSLSPLEHHHPIQVVHKTFPSNSLIQTLHWVPLTTSNLIHENVLIVSGTRCNWAFKTLMSIRSVPSWEKNYSL